MNAPSTPRLERLDGSRDATVLLDREGHVVKRYRSRATPTREVEVMQYVSERGYPVPGVIASSPGELVLERVHGSTMLEAMLGEPESAADFGLQLGRLQQDLHRIAAPDGLGRAVHLDFHPGNVILSDAGPVVIDWHQAGFGDPRDDVAATWLLLATAELPHALREPLEHRTRQSFLEAYLSTVPVEDARQRLGIVATWLAKGRTRTPAERVAIQAHVREHGDDGRGGHAPT